MKDKIPLVMALCGGCFLFGSLHGHQRGEEKYKQLYEQAKYEAVTRGHATFVVEETDGKITKETLEWKDAKP